MPTFGLIEGRNTDQSMYADLAAQQSECVLAVHTECRRFDARFFTWLVVVKDGLEALALGPAQIHAHEHLRPVLRLSSARAGMNSHNGVACVVFAREQGFGLEPVNPLA